MMASRSLNFSIHSSRLMCQFQDCDKRREVAFSRTDMLVCISLVLLFGVMGAAALSHGERDARLVKCRNNLRELHQASTAYGLNHEGNTPPAWPSGTSGGSWAWDTSPTMADELLGLGARPENFY
jgi:hypothetical protein